MKSNNFFNRPNILIVDDMPDNIAALKDLIKDMDCNIFSADSGSEAIEKTKSQEFALILLDVHMPHLDGFKTAELIRSNKDSSEIPIIFITAMSKKDQHVFKGYESGAVDYLFKPINPMFLRNKVKVLINFYKKNMELAELLNLQQQISDKLIESSKKLDEVNTKLRDEIEKREKIEVELKEKNKQLENLTRTDPLTGLSNRRDIIEKMEFELSTFERYKRAFSLAIGDIDNFKSINDTYGHDCGDFILIEISNIMKSKIRTQDFVSRWGGEEFLIFFPQTDIGEVGIIAERIRDTIEKTDFTYNDINVKVTISFGCSNYDRVMPLKQCIKYADERLYKAKESGKNVIITE